ncbi:unnamed protein product [Caenorhabditis auriculariae]|uniref:Uncharacterized protein n=1 Tax=Caenorhabditis auriculariae TaxID=2777116 RepID=A0A8S1H8E7_9PELO|nr:unnamed protein product [Caenorhabditis auriculariae]
MNGATATLDAGHIYQISTPSVDGKIPTVAVSASFFGKLIIEEHNWAAEQLKVLLPRLTSTQLFEEARKFVIAELQHIAFTEWLPLILGEKNMFFNFMREGSFKSIANLENVEDLLNTVALYPGPHEAKEKLSSGYEMTSSMLMTSRDHSIGTYAQWRQLCVGEEVGSFNDLQRILAADPEFIRNVQELYDNVAAVDLMVLALSEKPSYGSLLGPDFELHHCAATKFGDDLWYERYLNEKQLDEVRKTTMASLICRHSEILKIQPNPFIVADIFLNSPIFCNFSSFGNPSLKNWIEETSLPADNRFAEVLEDCIETVNSARAQRINDNFDTEKGPSAFHSHGRMMLAKDEAVEEANVSLILLQATKKLVFDHHFALSEVQGVSIGASLQKESFTGWCNNLERPHYGNTFTELRRILDPAYEDGVDLPRSKSSSGNDLPSPRAITNAVHHAAPFRSPKYSHMLMEMGQFIDHDITHSPIDQNPDGTPLNCTRCDSVRSVSPSCFPIPIPTDDPFFTDASSQPICIPLVRSLPAQKTLGYRNQMNQVTAFLDGSVIYGSTDCEAQRLREFTDGKLKSTRLSGFSHFGITLPPSDETEQDGCLSAPSFPCFLAGDDRNSQNTLLISIQTVFLREHDRLAKLLKEINGHWDDEKLYQETRKIVSAEFAHVVYNEYLPKIIGEELMSQKKLRPLDKGYFGEYDDKCDASILQPFATAAFRWFFFRHTPIVDSEEGVVVNVVDLAVELLNMTKIYEDRAIEGILGGMSIQPQMATDRHVDDALRNSLFAQPGKPRSGLDLPAINIQRGREHGIPPYNRYREYCGLRPLSSFHSLFADISEDTIHALGSVYESPEDVDLFTGIISEKNVVGGIVGPTAACIISEQFRILKQCDRFFYESNVEHVKFTPSQLDEIRKVSMASLICANTKALHIARDVFSIPDDFLNAQLDCSLFKQLDTSKWEDQKSCRVGDQKIDLHATGQTSPCTSCACTTEGLKCSSFAIDCKAAARKFALEDFEKDPICLMRCSNYLY